MNGVSFTGSSVALQIAALEVEASNQQQAADKTAREAARNAKLAAMEEEESAMRKKADALMTEAIIGGTLRVAGGAAKASAGYNRLEAATSEHGAGTTSLTAGDAANGPARQAVSHEFAADMYQGGAYVSETLTSARTANLDADAAHERRIAEQAQFSIDDKSDQIRRQEEQFTQKLSLLEDMLRSSHETSRVIIRG